MTNPHRIALGIEYDGTPYHGWQRQTDLISVQSALEEALSQITKHPIRVHCAGRTDAGVHALGQVVHFDTPALRPMEAWTKGVNTHLPKSIRVRWAKTVSSDFHARFCAVSRRYLYLIYPDRVSPGVLRNAVTWVHYDLNTAAMQNAADHWLGEHDFTSFRASQCQSKTPIRTLHHFNIRSLGKLIVLDLCANAFLHHMVRNMVGVLLKIGRGYENSDYAKKVLEARDRAQAEATAPASGLYLYEASYPELFGLPSSVDLPWFIQGSAEKSLIEPEYS